MVGTLGMNILHIMYYQDPTVKLLIILAMSANYISKQVCSQRVTQEEKHTLAFDLVYLEYLIFI